MAKGILRVKGEEVVDEQENVVILRGTALGGWMKYMFRDLRHEYC